jgi:hypothetical protein
VARTDREERTKRAQFSPCLAISLIGETRRVPGAGGRGERRGREALAITCVAAALLLILTAPKER